MADDGGDSDVEPEQVNLIDDPRMKLFRVCRGKGKIGWTRDADTLMIEDVAEGGAAHKAGIRPGMRIQQIGDVLVATDEELTKALDKAGPEFDVVVEVVDEHYEKVVIPPEEIEALRSRGLAEQVKVDEEVMKGVALFMDNQYKKAEETFERLANDPMAAVAWASVGFLRAAMSFEVDDMKEAARRLAHVDAVGTQICPPKGVTAAIMGLWKSHIPTNIEVRCRCARAEAAMMRSLLLLTEEHISSFLRAGLGLRRGYNEMDALSKGIDAALKKAQSVPPGTRLPGEPPEGVPCAQTSSGKRGDWPREVFGLYDYHTVGGVQFGVGSINVTLSVMPARVLAVLSLFGFMCEREAGYQSLTRAFEGGGSRACIAGLFLMFFHCVLPSFASVLSRPALPRAQGLMKRLLDQYPNSSIFLWMAGRVARLGRDLAGAIKLFHEAIEKGNKKEFVQLTHLAYYELAWCYCFDLQWDKAIPFFALLAEESTWSPAFYIYAQAACYEQLGDTEKARELFLSAPDHSGRVFGGRTISVEQYLKRKVAMWKENGFRNMRLPGIELVMLFNGFPQMPQGHLQKVVDMVKGKIPTTEDREEGAVLKLMHGNAAKELGDFAVAHQMYESLEAEFPAKKWRKVMKQETWVLPYTYYEHACLAHLEGDDAAAKSFIHTAEKMKDFNFEMPLALRIHLTKDLLRTEKDAVENAGGGKKRGWSWKK